MWRRRRWRARMTCSSSPSPSRSSSSPVWSRKRCRGGAEAVLLGDERQFPALAAIVREIFLISVAVRFDVQPQGAHQNRAVVERIGRVKFAPSILEGADEGRSDHARLAVGEIFAPLPG